MSPGTRAQGSGAGGILPKDTLSILLRSVLNHVGSEWKENNQKTKS